MDFVEKPCAVPALRWVIDRALAEAKKGISGHADIDDTARLNRLTVREREVFDLLAKGDTNKGVGRTLDISARTVETHRARVMEKLELRNLAELVRLAQRAATVEGMRDPAS
jgi:two-component system response regulator FixJ